MVLLVPLCKAKQPKQKPWVTPDLVSAFHRRDRPYKRHKSSNNPEHRKKFLALRHKAQQEERSAYKSYTDSIFDIGNKDLNPSERQSICKRFWSFIKSRRRDSCGIAPLKSKGLLVSDGQGKANILNKQYTSVFNKDDTEAPPDLGRSPYSSLPDIPVTRKGVEKLLQGLNPSMACGPDKLPPSLLKNLANVLSKPLTTIFQASLDQGTVPWQWKKALVSPIFKKGYRHQASNYRPVSLTSVCGKLCEHLVAKAIMEHFDGNDILSDSQHGFRARRSCETQLLSFIDELF